MRDQLDRLAETRIEAVKIRDLRGMSIRDWKNLNNRVLVVEVGNKHEQAAIILSYELYMEFQEALLGSGTYEPAIKVVAEEKEAKTA